MEVREPSAKYSEMASDLLEREPLLSHVRDSRARIVFLESDKEKLSRRKVVFAECEKVPEKWQWAVPYDFAITVYGPNVERFTEAQLEVLLFHELLHVGVGRDGNDETYWVAPHDVEDFRAVIERHGLDWAR